MADIRDVTTDFSVAPQLEPEDFAEAAALGFTHIINNRPDAESPNQLNSAEAETAAKAAGLTYVHAPFVGQPTPEAVRTAAQAKGKTLAYCRSGTRSVTAWAFAQAGSGGNAEQIIGAAANAGYNLGPMAGFLKQLGAR